MAAPKNTSTRKHRIRSSIGPAILDNKNFSTIHQGKSTNILTKLRAVEGKNTIIDPITGTATIQDGNFFITITQFAELSGLKTSTHQLLDALTIALTENSGSSQTVMIPLSEYMRRRALKDRKEARSQIKADLEVLRQVSMTWEEKRGSTTTNRCGFMYLADNGEITRNGDIIFTFGRKFHNILLGYPVMPYPNQLLSLNNKKNPNSYYLLRKIAEHKNMNVGKKNENIISVKTLLAVASFIPSLKDVMDGNKNITDRIITPFERDLDALVETLSWHYAHSNERPLSDDELATMNYSLFERLMINIVWRTYPEQTGRLDRKAMGDASKHKSKKQ